MVEIRGGDKLAKALAVMSAKLTKVGTLRVGFLEKATYPGGTPVALIAAIHNWGAPRAGIPPRPFFSNMIAKKQGEWPDAIGNVLVASGYDARRALDVVGHAIVGQLKAEIIATNSPPLAQSTIDRKGHAKPLIDTSHMINSVDFEVR